MYFLDTTKLSTNSCLYLITVLRKSISNKYSFSEGLIPSKLQNETIKLPTKMIPDFRVISEIIRAGGGCWR